jgi:hypothetical protein
MIGWPSALLLLNQPRKLRTSTVPVKQLSGMERQNKISKLKERTPFGSMEPPIPLFLNFTGQSGNSVHCCCLSCCCDFTEKVDDGPASCCFLHGVQKSLYFLVFNKNCQHKRYVHIIQHAATWHSM